MQIRRVHAVYFSGTGTTEKTVRRIAAQAAQQLGAELSAMDFTPPQARQETLHFAPEELVIFGVPTYAGRVPNVLLPFLKERVQGGGALAAAVVLFGNRNFDDSLIALRDILLRRGALVFPHTRRGPSRRGGHGGDGRICARPRGEGARAPGRPGGAGFRARRRADPPLLHPA